MAQATDHPDLSKDTELKPAAPAVELKASELRGKSPVAAEELARITADGGSAAGEGDELLGQQRALDAIRLAIGVDAPGYNVFVSGLRTREERQTILKLLEEKAAAMPTPGDWVYVNNFRSPESPLAIYLRPGQGNQLKDGMQELVAFIIDQLPKAFQREDFDQERNALREKYNKRAQELFGGFEARARERGFAIQSAPNGQVIFIPLIKGKMPESPDELSREMAAMPEAERERLGKVQGELQTEMGSLLTKQQEIMRELINDIRAIERSFAAHLITPTIDALKHEVDNPAVSKYLDQVAEHMLGHLERFRETPEAPPGAPPGAEPFGRSATNFTRIIPGSFLKAHGGFLLFDLEDAVVEPGVWKTLKRSLKTGRMTLETYEPLPFFMVSGLKPEPIEIHNKVVVLGGAYLYNMLYFYDPEFAELFKVKAEIRPVIDADRGAAHHYAARIGNVIRRENLPAFDGKALERIVEFGMRAAGDRERVLSMMEPIDDLAREAAYFARAEDAKSVLAGHVERALNERMLRLNFIEEEIRRLIANGTLIVHLDGKSVGRPSRVSATVALGQSGVINIEREARLSGSTHDKGIMILSGFLRARFGQEHPLAMTASICFEQSYSGIDGDSASSTELYALLSALSGVPIRQDFAVTGSVDQYGTVQSIGGANEKINGYYRVCKAAGLTGKQGALVPRTNLRNLMLDFETVDAVERGVFHIYPVDTIDQGIEILTGVRAGTIDEPGTINFLVAKRLKAMAERLREQPSRETHVVQEPASAPAAPRPPSPPEPQR